MTLRVLVTAVLTALGCAQGEPIPSGALDTAQDVGGLEQPINGCARVFSPVAELVGPAAEAAQRWSAATGCDIQIGDGGIPIRTAQRLVDETTGASLLGGTHWAPLENVIDADIGGATLLLTVAHEMGHALVGRPGHAESGLMRQDATLGSKIDDATLELVCSELPCVWIRPEL